MAVWTVNIVPGDPPKLVAPDQPKSEPGTVYADSGDVVFWNNTTNDTYQISLLILLPSQGIVTPGHQSDAFNVGASIDYTCRAQPNRDPPVVGKIIVT